MTWQEAAGGVCGRRGWRCCRSGAIEAHGPHLPLGTDVYLSLELAARLQAALDGAPPAVVLPPLVYTVTECAAGFSGHLVRLGPKPRARSWRRCSRSSAGTAPARWRCSTAISSPSTARCCARRRRGRALVRGWCSPTSAAAAGRSGWARSFRAGDCHAGAYETSLLLASRFAEQVRLERARALEPRWLGLVQQLQAGRRRFEQMGAEQAYFGDPAAASREQGERLWAVLVAMWLEALRG
ncbi:MAG: creatinine amidohydrolase [Planctomycetota bacterium]|nr:MAG: creatinine amidohydrolase [Planctomycetota bacterium]